MEASQDYGGSLIQFDLPMATDYLGNFCNFLKQQGYMRVERQPGRANIVKAATNNACCFYYFQGAGATAWWAFSSDVIQKWAKNSENAPLYLALGLSQGGGFVYWRYKVRQTEQWEERLMISGSDPTKFKLPFERFDRKGGQI